MPYFSEDGATRVGKELLFSVYHIHDMTVVSRIRQISKKYPDDIIYVSYTPENYNWFKEERYQVKNGIFFSIDVKWHDGLEHDWPDNEPKLLIVTRVGHNHLIPDLAAYHLP
jgi:hypothetical protein